MIVGYQCSIKNNNNKKKIRVPANENFNYRPRMIIENNKYVPFVPNYIEFCC